MAEAVPYGIATEILCKLGSSLFQEIGSFYGVKKDLQKLENTLSTVKAALLDAEERQEKSHLVQDWIRKLKDAVFDADDLLDAAATRASQLQLETHGRRIKKVCESFLSPELLAFRYKMNHEIKDITKRLNRTADDMAKFNFRERVVDLQVGYRERGQTHSFVLTSEVIGRDENKEDIVKILVSPGNEDNCSIIPIVGIGGLGKTTLAQFVYNDERVVKFFEKRIWVCVTEDFDVELVVRKILSSMTNCELGNLDMDLLQIRLRENLNNKLYLLVLDDMWNENLERWIHLKNLLVGGANGSKILVTTRSRKVASVMGVDSSYLLKGLTEEESWTLFKKITFRGRLEKVDANLEAIGKRMLERCKGVPLAIKTLGSVLQFKKEGYSISKNQLIQLWMAQGYILSSSGNQNLEEIGDQYFSDLLLRHLQQVKGLRTFLLPVNDRWINESNQATLISSFRRLRVLDMHCLGIEKLPCTIGQLKHLRYLDISNNDLIESLPGCICDLHNLQTLLLSRCERLEQLPRDIRKLINLRHLVIIKCPRLQHMPQGLEELTFLRTLSRFIVPRDKRAGSDRAKLNELNGLNLLRGSIWLKNLECLIDSASESKKANLKGKIYLQFLGLQWSPVEVDDRTRDETLLENLQPHPNLKHLWVEGYGGLKLSCWLSSLIILLELLYESVTNAEYGSNDTTSLSAPTKAFFPSLQELRLYRLPNFKGWQRREFSNENDAKTATLPAGNDQYLRHLFPCLLQLTIERCSNLTLMPVFPHLESLHLINSSVKVTAASVFFTFPSSISPFSRIQFLCIDKSVDLECLPKEGLHNLTSLKTLQISNCPRLMFLSPGINFLTQLSSLEIYNCGILNLFDDKGIMWQGFRGLCHLTIDYLPQLFYLPEGLQRVTALQELRILSCYNLVSLPEWIKNFSSLQELEISDCSSLKSLPEGIHELVSLKKLKIAEGPNSSDTWQRNTGKDWSKIFRIPETRNR
ncbi:ATP binding protein, putative [Ricinus communis]|uniref:ATP binding protein, putative n=1 Tax=Ricinus communis TaxID=3988 RepID=B9SVH3_RICCO|nr:ATP binding protein, putative [Ricinus communis]